MPRKVFGYRGVILFPWLARVYDRDLPNKKDRQIDSDTPPFSAPVGGAAKEIKGPEVYSGGRVTKSESWTNIFSPLRFYKRKYGKNFRKERKIKQIGSTPPPPPDY